ncbi:carbohydrate ABC transporter membrane protein 2, CUT1 family [Rubellimicrobium thermophilum DSM 16684]|uniref:Carbohydrate ABC transporter membrane protein 2, CUT1 family n=1 Tax=Rubellimicrobium thermophilum DSM 16684 TaxID=1123069 RepID=S9SMV6_9RHOB|nr:carbohydrate ABC transporter permease [Rubellimicrobium thermophilum]EPX87759.1 carbohydrate ABC transporter membrane protein 2, CUT1 family [Rubellimicrobium thermophilum DSM 16684]
MTALSAGHPTRRIDLAGVLLTLLTLIAAAIWFLPIYWALVTSLRFDADTVREFSPWPSNPTLQGYIFGITNSNLPVWYLNSTITSVAITVIAVLVSACAGYAISQLRFPGRRLLWWIILASFMIPVPALIVNHFIIIAGVGLLNTHLGIILPMLITPVTVIVYKQFFDSLPREYREAAVMDGASEFQLLFRLFLPMNWGVTTAMAIITFIGAWNSFLWPFLAANNERMMTVTVGIATVQDAFGVAYGRILAGAVLASLPVALAYLLFQRRVTQAIALSTGIKG